MTVRASFKRVIKLCFLLITLPVFGLFLTTCVLTRSDNCFASFSQVLSLIPGKVGIYVRAAFYHLTCPNTSDDISVGFLTLLSHRNTTIAKGVYIGPQCNIGMCTIRENALVGSGVHILSGAKQHGFERVDVPIKDQAGFYRKITISKNSWIGNNATILAPVEEGCIVAAGSVLTKATQKMQIVAGNPAKPISSRDPYANSPPKT